MANNDAKREDFAAAAIQEIAQKAMFICANDQCLRFTGYGTTEGKARRIADAAHIAPASVNGPGASTRKTVNPRSDSSNGVWLCKICHKKVDDDPAYYPEDLLRRWKKDQEEVVRRIVGKDIEAALLELRGVKRYHDEMRELLAFFDSKRVFDEELHLEFPPRVLESITLIRERISTVRAHVAPDSDLFMLLEKLQDTTHNFLRQIGKDTDLRELSCDYQDPRWRRFAEELLLFRREMNILLGPLAREAAFPLRWLPAASDA